MLVGDKLFIQTRDDLVRCPIYSTSLLEWVNNVKSGYQPGFFLSEIICNVFIDH